MKPFLKWLGNKYQIIDKITSSLPSGKRLIEPFAGSAAVFLNTHYKHYILGDNNADLINTFQYLKYEQDNFIKYCRSFFKESNNQKTFLKNRDLFNNTKNTRLKSALFLYLNRHSYNGLIRYNSKGIFNAPFGQYKKIYFPEQEMLFFVQKSQNAKFYHEDFLTTMKKAKTGDVIYCDPPYVPLSKTSRFTEYGANTFGIKQQNDLINITKKLIKKGISVIISNHDTEFINKIYAGAKIHRFEVQRFISCSSRNKAKEVLAIFE